MNFIYFVNKNVQISITMCYNSRVSIITFSIMAISFYEIIQMTAGSV